MAVKRVLFYNSTFPTITQNFITREIVALLNRKKVDVFVVALEQGRKANVPEELRGRVTYFTTPKISRVFDGVKFMFTNPSLFIRAFVKYSQRPLSLGTAISMLPLVKRINPDLIHTNWITEGALIGNILSDLTGIPFSIECHAEDIYRSSQENIVSRVRDSKFVVTCTKYNKDTLLKLVESSDRKKIHVVYHHVDMDLFGGRVAQFSSETPVLYLVGRKVEKKGFVHFLRAARILKDRGVRFKAKIAGDDGPELENLLAERGALGLEDFVEFTKEASFSEHSHNYLESDIFVMPSIRGRDKDMDGIPNVVVEAMLAGLPVVATELGSISEIVENESTGYLFKEKDEKMLAERLELLLSDRAKRVELGKNGKARIEKLFDTIGNLEALLLS